MSDGDPSETVVALVVLTPAASPEDVVFVRERLAEAGFEVGPLGGIAMAISAPRSRFERYFSTAVAASVEGGWLWSDAGAGETRELPEQRLPGEIAGRVETVTFDEPAEPVEELGPWP